MLDGSHPGRSSNSTFAGDFYAVRFRRAWLILNEVLFRLRHRPHRTFAVSQVQLAL